MVFKFNLNVPNCDNSIETGIPSLEILLLCRMMPRNKLQVVWKYIYFIYLCLALFTIASCHSFNWRGILNIESCIC